MKEPTNGRSDMGGLFFMQTTPIDSQLLRTTLL